MEVYFSLGSNLGNREENIEKAIKKMCHSFETSFERCSSLYETEPWGFESDESFLNCAIVFDIDLEPGDILSRCKEIEQNMGREEKIEYDEQGKRIYHSRIIDIDILLIGDKKVDTPDLKVPHPLMYERDFVMEPLKEILLTL